ncbi:MAG: 2-C-methyl-D-erythritol 4-phosphate cytidylyltransferase, partial [Alphaproteobacteria bacterium]
MPSAVALVLAAGRARRLRDKTPKQYLALAGKPLLRRTLEAFTVHPRIDRVRAVIHPDDRELYERAT